MSSKEQRIRRAADTPGELDAFVDVVEWLHREHRVSFVQAGDEKIYAYGGGGYVVVVSERMFEGLVELETPRGQLRVEPNADGLLAITGTSPAGASAADLLRDGIDGLRRYYEKRYWRV